MNLFSNLELAPGERWFVARVLAHQETRAQLNLHRLASEVSFPDSGVPFDAHIAGNSETHFSRVYFRSHRSLQRPLA
jgi:hypothetical protein